MEIIEATLQKSLIERAFDKLKSLSRWPISQRLGKLEVCRLLSTLTDSYPLKIRLSEPIEKYYGKNLLERILQSKTMNGFRSSLRNNRITMLEMLSFDFDWPFHRLKIELVEDYLALQGDIDAVGVHRTKLI